MPVPILSLHHVTATVDQAQPDLDFYVKALGMRLVKKTVNFDNHNVYHFYYGNERGNPNTLMTTFPYGGWGVPVGTKGAGQVTVTSFSVPQGSLAAWRERLLARGYAVGEVTGRFGDEVLSFDDPSGLVIELIANASDDRAPWVAQGVGADAAVRGLYGATLSIRDPRPTIDFLTKVLGWDVVGHEGSRTRLAVTNDVPGNRIDILQAADAPAAVNGMGTVHHIAMAVADEDDQLRLREDLVRRGVNVTPVRDRQYFKSIYFREPGGVLYEAATVPPGFIIDEDLSALGAALKLPPWEEPHRTAIEQGLARIAL